MYSITYQLDGNYKATQLCPWHRLTNLPVGVGIDIGIATQSFKTKQIAYAPPISAIA